MMHQNEFGMFDGAGIIRAGHDLYGMCMMLNHVTRPYVPLTDAAHARSRKYARALRERLERHGYRYGVHYTETDSGMVSPI